MPLTEEQRREIEQIVEEKLRNQLGGLILSDRYMVERLIQIADGRGIQLGRTNGTRIGTATDQLLSFYGVSPVNQPDTIADPAGGATVDSQARTAINTIIDRLVELGLIA